MRHTGTLRHISARCWSAIALGALSACGGGDGGIDQQAEKALCFDSRVFAVGAKLNIDYVESGFATGARTETSVVLSDIATFNGSPNLVERRITTSGTSVRGETNYRVESNLSKYEKPLGPGVTGLYGTVANGRFGQQRTVLYNPPYEDRRGELKRGQEGVFTSQGIGTTTGTVPAGPTSFTRQIRVKFVGVDSLSLPAGQYAACRYDIRTDDGAFSSEWIYRGVVVRQERTTGTPDPEILEMKTGTLDGASL